MFNIKDDIKGIDKSIVALTELIVKNNEKENKQESQHCIFNHHLITNHDLAINNLKDSTDELILNVSKLTDKVVELDLKDNNRQNIKNKIYIGIVIVFFAAIFTGFISEVKYIIKSNLEYIKENQQVLNKEMILDILKMIELREEEKKSKEREKKL